VPALSWERLDQLGPVVLHIAYRLFPSRGAAGVGRSSASDAGAALSQASKSAGAITTGILLWIGAQTALDAVVMTRPS
jgi:hypothetical protein